VRGGIHRQHLAHLDELLGPAQRGPQAGLRVAAAQPAERGARRPPVAQPGRQLGALAVGSRTDADLDLSAEVGQGRG
jgi:hypothetical protein